LSVKTIVPIKRDTFRVSDPSDRTDRFDHPFFAQTIWLTPGTGNTRLENSSCFLGPLYVVDLLKMNPYAHGNNILYNQIFQSNKKYNMYQIKKENSLKNKA